MSDENEEKSQKKSGFFQQISICFEVIVYFEVMVRGFFAAIDAYFTGICGDNLANFLCSLLKPSKNLVSQQIGKHNFTSEIPPLESASGEPCFIPVTKFQQKIESKLYHQSIFYIFQTFFASHLKSFYSYFEPLNCLII